MKVIYLRVTDELHSKIEVLASKDDRSVNKYLIRSLSKLTGAGSDTPADSPHYDEDGTARPFAAYDIHSTMRVDKGSVEAGELLYSPNPEPMSAEEMAVMANMHGKDAIGVPSLTPPPGPDCCSYEKSCKHWNWDMESGQLINSRTGETKEGAL